MKIKISASILILLLVFLSYSIVFPTSFNQGVSYVNDKTPLSFPMVKERDFKLGLDLEGGAYLMYQADLSDTPEREKEQRMEGLRDLIERRVNLYGVAEPSVRVRGERLEVEIPGTHDLDEAISIIGETPFLDFREISTDIVNEQEQKWQEIENKLDKKRQEITFDDLNRLSEENDIENWEIIFQDAFVPTGLTGRHLQNARVDIHYATQDPRIILEFNEEGSKKFAEITTRNIGKSLATFLDGEILQEATVEEPITGGTAQITGAFSYKEAHEIARDLRIGALPVPIELIVQQSIGPELGRESLDLAVQAGLLGGILVSIFMIVIYGVPGLVSVISLAIYMLLVMTTIKIIPITLTLSGIAGFILSLGMAIDANVLVLSRVKEEMKKGNNIMKSVENGYNNAWSSIRDGNITTLVVALVLFFIATSFVRGFAIVLIIGILVSILCVMIVNRLMLRIYAEERYNSK